MSHVPYVSAVGSLMYPMLYTMPDIAHAECDKQIHGKPRKSPLACNEMNFVLLERHY